MADQETNVGTARQPIAVGEGTTVVTSHKQVVEALIKYNGIHDGIWGLFLRFGLGAMNLGPDDTQLQPAAVVPVVEIGIQKFAKETNISVDAAKVNPK